MRLLLHRASVIVDDFPTFREALPYQCKHSPNVIFFPLQTPSPQDERRVWPKKPKLQLRKIQLPHRHAIRIAFLIPRQHSIPAAGDTAASRKSQFRGMPVAFQEGANIGAVPSGLLSSQDSFNG